VHCNAGCSRLMASTVCDGVNNVGREAELTGVKDLGSCTYLVRVD